MPSDSELSVSFSADQIELLGRLKAERVFGDDLPEIVLNVFRACVAGAVARSETASGDGDDGQEGGGPNASRAEYGARRLETVLEPVTGKAVAVRRGEVLRMSLISGPQCVDFACFSLHDYKEYMSMGWTRGPMREWRIGPGDALMSKPPRFNPMMAMLEMSESCDNTTVAIGCHAGVYEMAYAFQSHPNCHDTIGEAIREFGLTPDDTHDPFCLWMNASWSSRGDWNPSAGRVRGEPGDHADLLATMDVLAVPVICGGASVFAGTGNYSFKPILVEVFEASEQTRSRADGYVERYALESRPKAEALGAIPVPGARELSADPAYTPQFAHHPMTTTTVRVPLGSDDRAAVTRMLAEGHGEDAEDVVRSAVIEWYVSSRSLFSFG